MKPLGNALRPLVLLVAAIIASPESVIATGPFPPVTQDTTQIRTLIRQAIGEAATDQQQAICTLHDAHAAARELNDTAGLVWSGRLIGQLYNAQEKYPASIAILNDMLVLAAARNYRDDQKYIFNALGMAYIFQANYDKALQCHLRSLEIRQEQGNESEAAIALSNIGFTYYKLEDYERALEYNLRSIRLKTAIHDRYDLDRLYINAGLCLYNLKQYDEAAGHVALGLSSCDGICSDDIRIEASFAMGAIRLDQRDLPGAEIYFNQSLQYSRKAGRKRFESENLVHLAEILSKEGHFNTALKYLDDAAEIARLLGLDELLLRICQIAAEIHHQRKDYLKLATAQAAYIALEEKIHNARIHENIAKVQSELEHQSSIQLVQSQQRMLQLREAVLEDQRRFNRMAVMTVLAFACMVVLLAIIIFRRKRYNAKLENEIRLRTQALQESYGTARRDYFEMRETVKVVLKDIRSCCTTLDGIEELKRLDAGNKGEDNTLSTLRDSIKEFAEEVEKTAMLHHPVKL